MTPRIHSLVLCFFLLCVSAGHACVTVTYDVDATICIVGQHYGYQVIRLTSPLSTPDAPRFTRYHVLACGPLLVNLDYPPHRRCVVVVLALLAIQVACWALSREDDMVAPRQADDRQAPD